MCRNHNEEEQAKIAADIAKRNLESAIKIKNDFLKEFPTEILLNRQNVKRDSFDTNGILYFLGSLGGKNDFQNPASTGFVRITSSTIDQSCKHENICSRELKPFFTSDIPNSWVMIDFVDVSVSISSFSLRHYHENGLFALLSWTVEGSNDGECFDIIWSGANDALSYALVVEDPLCGVHGHFDLKETDSKNTYRFIRITQTGLNSIGSNILSLSGWEFYGVLNKDSSLIPKRIVESKKLKASRLLSFVRQAQDPCRVFNYSSDFDNNGIMYLLGTNFGSESEWKNPGIVSHQYLKFIISFARISFCFFFRSKC